MGTYLLGTWGQSYTNPRPGELNHDQGTVTVSLSTLETTSQIILSLAALFISSEQVPSLHIELLALD